MHVSLLLTSAKSKSKFFNKKLDTATMGFVNDKGLTYCFWEVLFDDDIILRGPGITVATLSFSSSANPYCFWRRPQK